jgi:hypothetical protein
MATVPIRVKLTNVWDEIHLDLPADTPLLQMKQRVLEASHLPDDAAKFVVKYRGAELFDEARSLADLGIVSNAALVMLPRRRQPLQ